MNKKPIFVIGSISIDNTLFTKALPTAGTTTIADQYFCNVGGKGINQACAAHFLGANVSFFGAIGKDKNGEIVKEFIAKQGLNAKFLESDQPTGVAFIILEESTAENRILIVQGANNCISINDVKSNEKMFQKDGIFLTQFENNQQETEFAIKFAKEKGMTVVVNPAPIKPFSDEYFAYIDYIIPNEHELESLTGEQDPELGARKLLAKGVKNVIVTLGEKGSLFANDKQVVKQNPYKVKAIDTTAAGDSFIGAFVSKLSENADIKQCLDFASKASSIAVTRKGAIVSLPKLNEIK